MTCASLGTSMLVPTAAILPSRMSTVAFSSGGPASVYTFALVMAYVDVAGAAFTDGIAITARRAARTEIPYAKYETRKFLPSVLIAHPGQRSIQLPIAHQHRLRPLPPEASPRASSPRPFLFRSGLSFPWRGRRGQQCRRGGRNRRGHQ